ncbi:hypothetical protein M434DRAFT_378045 [Hypoxylon sp. CO27-5]|nr:hypothetical protein M434DRAFT_378045 [Hypoxylon sp. CO27-5]
MGRNMTGSLPRIRILPRLRRMRVFRGNRAEEPIPLDRADSPEMPEVPVSMDFGPVNWESGATVPRTPSLSPRSLDRANSGHPFNIMNDDDTYSRQTSSSHEAYELKTLPRQQYHNHSAPIEDLTTSLSEHVMESVEYTGNAGQAPSNPTQAFSSSDSPDRHSVAPVEANDHVQSPEATSLKRKRAKDDDGSSKQDRTTQSRILIRSVTSNLTVRPSPSSIRVAPGHRLKKSKSGGKGA